MVILVIVKVTKLSWFEHTEIQSIVSDLINLCNISQQHCLIAMKVMDDLIIEMGYVQRQKNLISNRRVSLSFRDNGLF